jgi:CheY-like chemotaxis protein
MINLVLILTKANVEANSYRYCKCGKCKSIFNLVRDGHFTDYTAIIRGREAMNGGRIFVVDDEESTRSTLHDYFVNFGYDVETAIDGEDALEKFIPGKFDCVISDLFMPRIDGLELLRKIRMLDSKVFFLMITGYPSIDSAVNVMKEGAYDYVTKPFNLEDIRIKVERGINNKRTEESLKKMTGLFWGLIVSIPIWLILGIILGIVWK